jgi:cation transport regulator ChaB
MAVGLAPQLLNFSSESAPSALDQVNDHDDDGNHDQEMNETAANVAEEAKKPEHEQDNNDSPEHGVPFD